MGDKNIKIEGNITGVGVVTGGVVNFISHINKWIVSLVIFLLLVIIAISFINSPEKNSLSNNNYTNIIQLQEEKIENLQKQLKRATGEEKEQLSIAIEQAYHELNQKTKELKELKNRLEQYGLEEDSIRKINNILETKGIDSALDYLNQIDTKSVKNSISKKLLIKGDLYNLKNKYKEANQSYQESILFQKTFDNLKAYSNYLSKQNRYSESIEQLNKTNDLNLTIKQQAMRFNNLGILYSKQDNIEKSEEAYLKSLELFRKSKDKIFIAKTLNNLGNLYMSQELTEKAEKLYIEALYLYRKIVEKESDINESYMATILTNLGSLYRIQEKYQKSEDYYNEALTIRKKIEMEYDKKLKSKLNISVMNNNAYIADIYNNLGNLYKDRRAFKKAKKLYDMALKIYRELVEINPNAYNKYVEKILNNLDIIRNIPMSHPKKSVCIDILEKFKYIKENNANDFLIEVNKVDVSKCPTLLQKRIKYIQRYLKKWDKYKKLLEDIKNLQEQCISINGYIEDSQDYVSSLREKCQIDTNESYYFITKISSELEKEKKGLDDLFEIDIREDIKSYIPTLHLLENLINKEKAKKKYNWYEARDYCLNLNANGYTNWHLAHNYNKLRTILIKNHITGRFWTNISYGEIEHREIIGVIFYTDNNVDYFGNYTFMENSVLCVIE